MQDAVTTGPAHAAYVLVLALGAAATLAGGMLRFRERRLDFGDLALAGGVALAFATPLGMVPRFLAPYAPVIGLWAAEGARRWVPHRLRGAALAAGALVLLGTAAQGARLARGDHDRGRAAAYAGAAREAR